MPNINILGIYKKHENCTDYCQCSFYKGGGLLMIEDYYNWNVAKSMLSFSVHPSLMHEVTC